MGSARVTVASLAVARCRDRRGRLDELLRSGSSNHNNTLHRGTMNMTLLLLVGLALLAGEASAEVFTNSFLVKMREPAAGHLADKIATRNGFVNLGPVSS